ncbi:hypothetical protein CENSYa_0458 [Cenarchaeum symbiosum A]|uniref:Uncharacterized protein n=1 Tax=Cenarchaeum symbiosum (strain A) TaxID=414004 RepID=A0RUS5_CENSY|nr:hypothetical protein CENSYa_0458 [Cenarchaeum symbiosum A]
MTSCSGCGTVLGRKKYRFHKMWRIPGHYCKKCMLVLGQDFDDHGKLTLPKTPCKLCETEIFFPVTVSKGGKRGRYCSLCSEAVEAGAVAAPGSPPSQVPARLPHVMMMFAGLGVLMMALGLIFTLGAGDGGLVNILFGAVTTALGFMLFRKTIRSRSLLLGKTGVRQNAVQD